MMCCARDHYEYEDIVMKRHQPWYEATYGHKIKNNEMPPTFFEYGKQVVLKQLLVDRTTWDDEIQRLHEIFPLLSNPWHSANAYNWLVNINHDNGLLCRAIHYCTKHLVHPTESKYLKIISLLPLINQKYANHLQKQRNVIASYCVGMDNVKLYASQVK